MEYPRFIVLSRELFVKRFIVFVGGLGLIGSIVWFVVPPSGRSVFASEILIARLLIEVSASANGNQENLLADETLRITSRTVIERAVSVGQLGQLASFKEKDVIEFLSANLTAARWPHGHRVVEIRLRCRSESDGLAALQAIIDAYIELNEARVTAEGHLELKSYMKELSNHCIANLESQTAQHAKLVAESPFPALNSHEAALKALADDVSRRTRLLTEREAVAAALRSRVNVLTIAVDAMDTEEVLSLFVLDDPNARQETGAADIVKRLLPLFQNRSELLKRVGRDHPDVKKVEREIASTREFLGKPGDGSEPSLWNLVTSYVATMQMRSRMVEGEIVVLDKALRDVQSELRSRSEFVVRDRQLRRAIETTKRQFDLLAKKIEDIPSTTLVRIEVVESPKRQQNASQSRWPFLTIIGSLIVICSGLVLPASRPATSAVSGRDVPTLNFPVDVLNELQDKRDQGMDAEFHDAVRRIVAVIRLARLCGGRDHAVLAGEHGVGIAGHVKSELLRAGVAVRHDASSSHDSVEVNIISDSAIAADLNPDRVLRFETGRDWIPDTLSDSILLAPIQLNSSVS